jgi:anti-sigma regulatory factor (Ser/Thr protein kinase)
MENSEFMLITSGRQEGSATVIKGEIYPTTGQCDALNVFLSRLLNGLEYERSSAEDNRCAAGEIVNNAVVHGSNTGEPVAFRFYFFPNRVRVEIEDKGTKPYDPNYKIDLSKEGVLKTSGRGLFIANYFADVVDVRNLMSDNCVIGHLAIVEKKYKSNPSSR